MWRAAVRRLLRPIARPLLYRLDHQIRIAARDLLASPEGIGLIRSVALASVAESGVAGRLQSIEEKLRALPEEMQAALARAATETGLIGRLQSLEEQTRSVPDQMHAALARTSVGLSLLLDEIKTKSTGKDKVIPLLERIHAGTDMLLNRHVIPLSPHLVAIRTPFGYVAVPRTDPQLVIYLCEGVAAEPGTALVFKALLRSDECALDIGANVGVATLALAQANGPAGRVIAVEPSAETAEALRATLLVNGLRKRVEVHECAATDQVGSVALHLGLTSAWNSVWQLDEPSRETQVEGQPIDAILPPSSKLALAKIDVEGAELLVLNGMHRTIEDNPQLALILEYAPSHLQRAGISPLCWMQAVRARGLDVCFRIDEASGACRRVAGVEDLDGLFSTNLLFARAGSQALARLSEAGLSR